MALERIINTVKYQGLFGWILTSENAHQGPAIKTLDTRLTTCTLHSQFEQKLHKLTTLA